MHPASALSQRCCAQQKPVFVRRQVKALSVASVPQQATKPQQNTMQHGRVSWGGVGVCFGVPEDTLCDAASCDNCWGCCRGPHLIWEPVGSFPVHS